MSTEWKIVSNSRVVSNAAKKTQAKPTKEEKIKKQEQWEQSCIDEYNTDFPLLPGGKDLVPDKDKIAYIVAKRAAKKEENHKAYLQREARRQAKREAEAKRAAEAKRQAEIAEKLHVQNMIEKWGAHRWYRRVAYTEDDCDTAERLRYEEEEREWEMERQEREEEEAYERREKIRQAEEDKYIDEQTANMNPLEKERWIREFKYRRMLDLEDEIFSVWERAYYYEQKQEKEDKERLDRWNAKQEKNKN